MKGRPIHGRTPTVGPEFFVSIGNFWRFLFSAKWLHKASSMDIILSKFLLDRLGRYVSVRINSRSLLSRVRISVRPSNFVKVNPPPPPNRRGVKIVKPATGRPYVRAFSLSGTVPAFTCDCLRFVYAFYATTKVRHVCVYVFENNA